VALAPDEHHQPSNELRFGWDVGWAEVRVGVSPERIERCGTGVGCGVQWYWFGVGESGVYTVVEGWGLEV